MAAEVKAGEPWWLDADEEQLLASYNERHTAASVVSDRVHAVLILDPEKAKKLKWVTPSELLIVAGIAAPTNAQAKECGAILRELYGQPSRIRGRERWAVPIIDTTGGELVITLDKSAARMRNNLEDKETY